MKKLFSLVLALALLLSLSVPAFAAEITPNGNNASADVNGTYVAGAESDIVYSVDIAWEGLNFTYTDSSKGTWNPTNHAYENGTAASWSGTGNITVTNHSNDGIVVIPAYMQEEAYKDASMNFDATALTVASADNGEGEEGAGAAKSGTITVTPTGSLPAGTSETKIGTITLTIEGALTAEEPVALYVEIISYGGNPFFYCKDHTVTFYDTDGNTVGETFFATGATSTVTVPNGAAAFDVFMNTASYDIGSEEELSSTNTTNRYDVPEVSSTVEITGDVLPAPFVTIAPYIGE